MLFLKLFFKNLIMGGKYLLVGALTIGLFLGILSLLTYHPVIGIVIGCIIIFLAAIIQNTYQDWQKEQFNAIKKKKEHYEEKLISCVKHWEKAENETECQYWAEEKDCYCNLINESQDKLKKLLEKMGKNK